MNRIFSFLLVVILSLQFAVHLFAQTQQQTYSVGFYNVENLFDTIHDKGKNDYEFLPDGVNKWGAKRYAGKIKNIARVINEMSLNGMFALGVCEVENSRVLDDLVKHPQLVHGGWKYIHFEGADGRGIDCALLYKPELFKPIASRLVPYTNVTGNKIYKTRGFLVVCGEVAGERMHIIVNHWPSRNAQSLARERAALLVRGVTDSIMRENPASKIVIMGDFNDNPDDFSIEVSLGAKPLQKDAKQPSDLYSPWCSILHDKGIGTLKYNNKWNLYDQIIINAILLQKDNKGLKYKGCEIFVRNYLLQQKGRYKGAPKRTFSNGVWFDGYSDHLPVIMYFTR